MSPRPRREERHPDLQTAIKETAWKQIAEFGAPSIGLRSIARELNITGPSIYNYYPSRDDLVTALIVDAYNSLADAQEACVDLLSSAVFLAAVGVLYGVTGTLNLADLALAVERGTAPGVVTMLPCLFLVAFGIKAALFPLVFWLPASYHTPPVAVSAIFAGVLTKVGVYALVRAFTLVFTGDTALTHGLILAVAVLTMATGVLGAAAQFEFRRVLSFHIVSQIGYMVLGLGLFTPLALAGTVFYLIHHVVVKTNLFLACTAAPSPPCGTAPSASSGSRSS